MKVTDLDFNDIKTSLKNYLKGKPEFQDFDFEGSTINTLMDVLAYNTYQNAFYTNMAVNEMYLDSARKRENAVSIAKNLGYVPRSARSAKATVSLTFAPADTPDEIIIPKGTRFKTTIDKTVYEFLTNQDYVVVNSDGIYEKSIDIYEGTHLVDKFTFNSSNPEDIILQNENIDIDSIVVYIYENDQSTNRQLYTKFSDLVNVVSEPYVFYIEENYQGYYKIYFGDGILGDNLDNGNVIEISYRVCEGSNPNGAQQFTPVSYVGYNSQNDTVRYNAQNITLVSSAANGDFKESLESIKFYAPRYYEAQGRAITPTDYRTYVLNNFPYIQSVRIWGGEEHDPPMYGRVMISAKPFAGFYLSQDRKDAIFNFLNDKNALSIEPVLIDPTFMFIRPTITVNYDSSLTSLKADEILAKVSNTVLDFENTKLGVFDSSFSYSKFISAIDASDESIVSNEVEILFEKRTTPIYNSNIKYRVEFRTQIYHPYEGYLGAISSNQFKLTNIQRYTYLDDDGYGNIRLYYLDDEKNKVYVDRKAGTVDYITGTIVLTSFNFEDISESDLKILIKPNSNNYSAIRNQILLLSYPRINLFDTRINNIVQSGIIDAQGNVSFIYSNNIDNPVVF